MMFLRKLPALLTMVALALFVSVARADGDDHPSHPHPHFGSFVEVKDNKIHVKNAKGHPRSYTLAAKFTVKVKGNNAKLSDIPKGARLRLDMDADHKVEAIATLRPRNAPQPQN
jgi:hypothetical protein